MGRQTRLKLLRHVAVPDAFGGIGRKFVADGLVSARFDYGSGDETVQAARLAGRTVFKIKIFSTPRSRVMTTDWRVRDAFSGDEFNIVAIDAVTDRAHIWLTVEGPIS